VLETKPTCRSRPLSWLCASVLILSLSATSHASNEDTRKACEALRSLATDRFKVETAEWVNAGRLPVGGPAGASIEAPGHCLFRVTLDPRPSGIEDMTYGIGIELRLPADWNGRLLFQGGGGLNGVLLPAVGPVSGSSSALTRGFAVVSTDSGHRGRSPVDARFGVDQQARLDFAYQGVERTTREAKALLRRFYGKPPERSYYMGCSTGGREAMLVAQRLPLEFDGVVAGNPAFNFTRIVVNQAWSLQAVTKIAPKDASGRPDLSRAYTDAQLKAVADAVLQQCDALDGLDDGMINDFESCRFDPQALTCGSAGAPAAGLCLTSAQAETLKTIFGGARNSRGESLYGTFPYDTGIATPAWRSMHLGSAGGEPANATLGRDTLRYYVLTPARPDFDPRSFDFDRDMGLTLQTAAINDAVATLHTTFAGRGGKMIVYHGLSDQAMATGALTDWYRRLTPRDAAGPQDWARLFLIPGMTHCGGGQSTDEFDMLSAIQAWVEQGRAPDRIVASGKAFPGKTRPLCPYPKVARYEDGNSDDERSFVCR
jgi:hypothetical protein